MHKKCIRSLYLILIVSKIMINGDNEKVGGV